MLEIATGYRLPPLLTSSGDPQGDSLDTGGGQQQQAMDPRSSQAQEDIVKAQLRAAKLKRSRALNEPCVIPNKLLHRIDVRAREGAYDLLLDPCPTACLLVMMLCFTSQRFSCVLLCAVVFCRRARKVPWW